MTPENEQEIERLKAALKEAAKSLAEDEQEIERLEGDANSLCNTITSIQLSLKERDAEIERLRADLDECYQDLLTETVRANTAEERNDRLQAVVERIATRDYDETAQEFARAALKGADDG